MCWHVLDSFTLCVIWKRLRWTCDAVESKNLCFVERHVKFAYVGVGVYRSEDPFVSFGPKPTHRACARDFPRDGKKTRRQRWEQGSRQNRVEQKKPVDRRTEQSTEVGGSRWKATARTCGPRGRVGQRERIS